MRTTEDIDFFVRPTPENVERIRAAPLEEADDDRQRMIVARPR